MIAKSFLANGAKVYITGRRLETLQKTAKEFPGLITLQMDVTSKDSIAAAAKVVEANDGRLDILVNNAGIPGQVVGLNKEETKSYGDSHFTEESFERWSSRKARKTGGETSSVINISSSGGDSHVSLHVYSYMVSKAALNYLTEILATEFALKKIPVRVNVLLPGYFPSEMAPDMPNGTESSPMPPIPGAINPIPLQRAGREEEIGIAAIYLASDAGSYTNGAHLRVDGGHYLVNP
ncbi:short-chain dehydrogenase [Moniliophthora roreri MCA 2997]|uniref:Short-chain dehydrogenase n=1 Tax=Moniliophthora roreri (strain MCA 2997) TaxID=1381753 RepID=V2WWK5_MONRO|nr:short-chain dehydrogenase [Moniliophthora roreri MCA 2997]